MTVKPNTKNCTTCGKLINAYRMINPEDRYYCGRDCYQANRKNIQKKPRSDSGRRLEYWASQPCEQCGESVEFLKSDQKNHERRFCNSEHQLEWFSTKAVDHRKRNKFGQMVGRPMGSTQLHVGGYLQEKTPQGWRMQHRVVMERILDRPLLKTENVHHLNGIRTDNRPENLELWTVMQPTGQRPEDLVRHAWSVIQSYDPNHDLNPAKDT